MISVVIPAFDEAGAGFIGIDDALTDFWFRDVRATRYHKPVALDE